MDVALRMMLVMMMILVNWSRVDHDDDVSLDNDEVGHDDNVGDDEFAH